MKTTLVVITVLLAFIFIPSCANKAQGPTGGPKDTIPPKVMRSIPENGAVNYKKKEIKIYFDENISVKNATKNVLISPPQSTTPQVTGNGRQVTVSFDNDLKDSTTYTINFGDAIVDLDEGNQLKDYNFSFATGSMIDTLQISGTLLNSENLNPVSGVYVGIYKAGDDSAFYKKPFLRITRTDDKGHFEIENIKPGTYQVFALDDVNNDYHYDPGESVAFIDSLVTPTTKTVLMRDTVWKDSTTIDSVRTYYGTKFLPDNILFRLFKEVHKRQFLLKSERKRQEAFNLIFNDKMDSLPHIKPLNFNWKGKYMIEKNKDLDTLTYWITDSLIYKMDTLTMQITYPKSDSLMKLVPQTDTLSLIMRRPNIRQHSRRNNRTRKKVKKEFYHFSTNANGTFEDNEQAFFHFKEPLANADLSKIHLMERVDTVLTPLSFKWEPVDSTRMNYELVYNWQSDHSYQISTDSLAFRSIYSLETDKFKCNFKVRALDEYGSVRVITTQYDSLLVFQLLNTRDEPIRTLKAVKGGTRFMYLLPGDYYIRAFKDINQNGKWDTGNLNEHKQPESVYYCPQKVNIRANWDIDQEWNINQFPLQKQKPALLKKDNNSNKNRR